jgi:hypothetical protein
MNCGKGTDIAMPSASPGKIRHKDTDFNWIKKEVLP